MPKYFFLALTLLGTFYVDSELAADFRRPRLENLIVTGSEKGPTGPSQVTEFGFAVNHSPTLSSGNLLSGGPVTVIESGSSVDIDNGSNPATITFRASGNYLVTYTLSLTGIEPSDAGTNVFF